MAGRYKTSLKPTLLVSAVYAIWAWRMPTAMGMGGYIIWTPVVAVVACFCHNMIRWMFNK